MSPFTLALVLCAPFLGQTPPPASAWPAISGGLVWVSMGHERRETHGANPPVLSEGRFVATLPAPAATDRAALEVLAVVPEDGAIVKFADKTIKLEKGALSVEPGINVPTKAEHGQPIDIAFVTRFNDVAVYANGEFFTSFPTTSATKISYARSDWKTSLRGLVSYPHPVSPGQVKRNAKAAADFVHGFTPGPPQATVELQLGQFTPVPDPSRIKPYRNALLAEEYKVVSVVDPGSTSLKPGDTVRVFRYGVVDGKQTSVKDLKTGDRVRLKIEPMASAAPGVQHEYQLDDLDTSYGTYYVEVLEG